MWASPVSRVPASRGKDPGFKSENKNLFSIQRYLKCLVFLLLTDAWKSSGGSG